MNRIYEHFLDRSLTHVMRFSSIPQQFQESVAEHSFYVAYFTGIQELYRAIRKVNRKTIPLAFEHLPAPLAKDLVALWKEDIDRVTKEAQIVKVADKLSLLSKCHEEMSLGNAFFKPIYERELENLRHLEWQWWQKIKDEVLPVSD